MEIIDVVKMFLPAVIAFIIGISITPIVSHYLYKHKMWKKKSVEKTLDGRPATISASLHNDENRKTPKMGGVVVWISAFTTALLVWIIAQVFPDTFTKLDFVSRNQTWIPIATLLLGGLIGCVDDFLNTYGDGNGGGYVGGGLSLKKRLLLVGTVSLLCALWFYFKLDVTSIGLPFYGDLFVGILFIPIFLIVTIGIYSGSVIDGVDGLSGGIMASIFAAYGGIAFYQSQIDLATLCAVIVGGILAFLWFNIPPARFYMSETGMMSLTLTLAVIAFMTDSLGGGYGVIVLPIIAFPLVATSASNIIQMTSKKFRNGKKVFLVAPIHNHFQVLGWPSYKVTMRYWIIGIICALAGLIIALIG
jgi:phospho-N-acetylmuramoyl-pentapeptide-transferase